MSISQFEEFLLEEQNVLSFRPKLTSGLLHSGGIAKVLRQVFCEESAWPDCL